MTLLRKPWPSASKFSGTNYSICPLLGFFSLFLLYKRVRGLVAILLPVGGGTYPYGATHLGRLCFSLGSMYMVYKYLFSASFSTINKFLKSIFLFFVGQFNQGKSEIFDEDEVSGPTRPFPPKCRIPREINYSPPDVGNCSTAPEVMPPKNHMYV